MNTRNHDVSTALQVVKDAAQNAMMDNGIKQETVADALGLTQSSVSKMMNYTGEQHLAVGHLPALFTDPGTKGVAMAVLIAIGGMMGLSFEEIDTPEETNGSIDDELLRIDVLQARIIELRTGDMRKVLALCQEIKHQVNMIEHEAQTKLGGCAK
jgi:hypothetical protein